MQTKLILASTALAFALGLGAPLLAQETAPAEPAPQAQGAEPGTAPGTAPDAHPKGMKGMKPPHGMRGMRGMHGPRPAEGAEIKLNFGGGRMVAIECGDTKIDACIAASMPLIEKVASTEPVPFPPRGPKKD